MYRHIVIAALFFLSCIITFAQTLPSGWTDTDRTFLLQNFERTRNEVIKETEKLTQAQWQFKETDTSWSIAQVVEHLALYERTFRHEVGIILRSKPEPGLALNTRTDSSYLAWMNEPQPHAANKIHIPLGLMKGKDNLTFFLYGRDLFIDFVKTTTADLKAYYTFRGGDEKRRSLHGLLVIHFGHTDRHLRQIRRIIQHKKFPK